MKASNSSMGRPVGGCTAVVVKPVETTPAQTLQHQNQLSISVLAQPHCTATSQHYEHIFFIAREPQKNHYPTSKTHCTIALGNPWQHRQGGELQLYKVRSELPLMKGKLKLIPIVPQQTPLELQDIVVIYRLDPSSPTQKASLLPGEEDTEDSNHQTTAHTH